MSRDDARRAVREALAQRGLSATQFARAAKVDPATLGDFLSGARWPRSTTLTKIDAELGWPKGQLEMIALDLHEPEGVSRESENDFVVLRIDLSSGEFDDLSVADTAEAEAVAQAAFLERVREIRNERAEGLRPPLSQSKERGLGRGRGYLTPRDEQDSTMREERSDGAGNTAPMNPAGGSPAPHNVTALTGPDPGEDLDEPPAPPVHLAAARDVGKPSAGERARAQQDDDAERVDE